MMEVQTEHGSPIITCYPCPLYLPAGSKLPVASEVYQGCIWIHLSSQWGNIIPDSSLDFSNILYSFVNYKENFVEWRGLVTPNWVQIDIYVASWWCWLGFVGVIHPYNSDEFYMLYGVIHLNVLVVALRCCVGCPSFARRLETATTSK